MEIKPYAVIGGEKIFFKTNPCMFSLEDFKERVDRVYNRKKQELEADYKEFERVYKYLTEVFIKIFNDDDDEDDEI